MMACDALSQRWRKTAAKRLSSGVVEDWGACATVGLPGACLLSDYLITLSQSGRLLASMTVSAARFAEVRELMRQRFPAGDGLNCASKRAGKAAGCCWRWSTCDRGTERWLIRWIACA